ncbi:MAG: aminopeptidase, partial [Blastocatellia bacterium]
MKRPNACLALKVLLIAAFFSSALFGQRAPARPNPEIAAMLREVSVKRIEADIRQLVSFGTRNTLSAQDNPSRGIGAARDWIFSEFEKISRECGGCLLVEKQSFTQPKAPRVPEPIVITNLVATLKGTSDPERIYVVSGHYDSMCSSPTDPVCDAPGANDDASGTAAVIELARIMSKRKFDASVVFIAVAGEEQGLLGATYFADQAKQKGMRIEAMFTNDIVGGVTTQKTSPNRNRVRVFSEGVPSSE